MRLFFRPILVICSFCCLSVSEARVSSSARSREVVTRVAPNLEASLSAQGLRLGQPVFIRIFKEEMALEVWVESSPGMTYQLFKTYQVVNYGGMGVGPKFKEGDRRAPEGFYEVRPRQMNPLSRFHLSFNLGYPNRYDRLYGRTGSALMVHGGRASIGCYAMTDPQIEEIYTLVHSALDQGQPFVKVHAMPFRMTSDKMRRHAKSVHRRFWGNLREGYQWFEKTQRPPVVRVDREKRRYTFAGS